MTHVKILTAVLAMINIGPTSVYHLIFMIYLYHEIYRLYRLYMGQVAQAARRLATDWTAWVRSRVSEGWRFSSLLCVQTGTGVH